MPREAASEFKMMMPGAVSKKMEENFDSINFTTNDFTQTKRIIVDTIDPSSEHQSGSKGIMTTTKHG